MCSVFFFFYGEIPLPCWKPSDEGIFIHHQGSRCSNKSFLHAFTTQAHILTERERERHMDVKSVRMQCEISKVWKWTNGSSSLSADCSGLIYMRTADYTALYLWSWAEGTLVYVRIHVCIYVFVMFLSIHAFILNGTKWFESAGMIHNSPTDIAYIHMLSGSI